MVVCCASVLVVGLLIAGSSVDVCAQWPDDPLVNLPICTAPNYQYYPQIVSDGSGGAIMAWYDSRGGSYDIYAQRVDASGYVKWGANGLAICTASGSQYRPEIIADGSGGAIITWYDYRTSSNGYDIYAQKVDASGAVQWTTNGVAICRASGSQYYPTIASDGSGGAIITWHDYRVSSRRYDVYAQRVNASGVVQWTTNGVPISLMPQYQYYPKIVSDGSGGAIITWYDSRNSSTSYDIYAQRINGSGVVQWAANGVVICNATRYQYRPEIVTDGSGGAIITWYDYRSTSTSYDIYAQRVSGSGAVQWTTNGVPVCVITGSQYYPQIASDGSGGAVITWYDYRNSSNRYDIYAQKVNASGSPQWTSNGLAVCTAPNYQ
jgi:phosphosulfolactate phosphohydrolase-like enzyme